VLEYVLMRLQECSRIDIDEDGFILEAAGV